MASRYRFVQNRYLLIGLSALALLVPSAALATKIVPAATPTVSDPPSACDAIAGNLVANCGFETGNFTSWTRSGNLGATGVSTAFDGFVANSGNDFAFLGPVGSDGFISQNLATTAGTYQLQWFLGSDGGTPNDFSATVNGVTLFSASNLPSTSGNYIDYMFNFVATGPTTLTFGFRNDPSYLALDDISVTPAAGTTPEPSSIFLFASGLMALGGSIKRKLIR